MGLAIVGHHAGNFGAPGDSIQEVDFQRNFWPESVSSLLCFLSLMWPILLSNGLG